MMIPGAAGQISGGVNTFINQQQKTLALEAQYRDLINKRITENHSLDLIHHRNEEDFKRNVKRMSAGITTPSVSSLETIKNLNKELGVSDIHLKI